MDEIDFSNSDLDLIAKNNNLVNDTTNNDMIINMQKEIKSLKEIADKCSEMLKKMQEEHNILKTRLERVTR